MARELDAGELGSGIDQAFLGAVAEVAGGLLNGSNLSAGGGVVRGKSGCSYLVVVVGGDRPRVEDLAVKVKDLVESTRTPDEKAVVTFKDNR